MKNAGGREFAPIIAAHAGSRGGHQGCSPNGEEQRGGPCRRKAPLLSNGRGTTATFSRCYSASHIERKGGVRPLPPLHSPAISLLPSSPLYSHGTEKTRGRERERRSRWSSPGAAISSLPENKGKSRRRPDLSATEEPIAPRWSRRSSHAASTMSTAANHSWSSKPRSNATADTKVRTPTPLSSATHNAATTVSIATSSEPLPLLLLRVRSTVAAVRRTEERSSIFLGGSESQGIEAVDAGVGTSGFDDICKLERTAVLKAICVGFKETSEPAICLSGDLETNECLDRNGGCWHGPKSNITACKVFKGMNALLLFADNLFVGIKGDGYTSCEAVEPGRCMISEKASIQITSIPFVSSFAFSRAYHHELLEAYECCMKYMTTGNDAGLTQIHL
nr:vacuolar-sorting receptor 6-like [Ipomoea batatas]